MRVETSSKASIISEEVTVNTRGRPVMRQRPLTSKVCSSGRGKTQPICILISSAVRSPMSTLCFRRMYLMMASSNWSPAILMEVDSTMPPREMTAISVVPPPMSTIMWPSGLVMSMPAPMAAARGSSMRKTRRAPAWMPASTTARSSTSVMPEGTQMTTRGLKRRKEAAFRINSLSIRSVMSKSEMTPSRRGRMATMLPGVRPSICWASVPTFSRVPLSLSMATTEGSRSTTPLPLTYTRMEAVPKSIPMSFANIPAPRNL